MRVHTYALPSRMRLKLVTANRQDGPSGLLGHPDELFANVLALEQPQEGLGSVLDALSDGLAVADLAGLDPAPEPVGDVIEAVLVVADDETLHAGLGALVEAPPALHDLVGRLGACERPYACPHGRPTVLTIEEAALARGFERGNTRL